MSKFRWSNKYDKCKACGTVDTKHYGHGLCIKCYKKMKYLFKRTGKWGAWSNGYDRCIICGRIDRPHAAKGMCNTCYHNSLNRKKGVKKRNFGAWSWYYDKCQQCGTVDRPHASNGLCVDCVEVNKRDLTDAVPCPVCGVKAKSINQHLAMRAKKCEEHKKYQHYRFKIYFESDMNLHAIGKELGMDRHAVTRQFITYFGEKETEERNERIRRCNISEKAIINKNYKNMYGTIVDYISPNQGEIKLRSKIEAKFADSLGDRSWWYERDSFPYLDMEGVRRTYTPDFYLEDEDKYYEVKGHDLLSDEDLHKINWVREHANLNIEIVEF